jgi:hypothetical protein
MVFELCFFLLFLWLKSKCKWLIISVLCDFEKKKNRNFDVGLLFYSLILQEQLIHNKNESP